MTELLNVPLEVRKMIYSHLLKPCMKEIIGRGDKKNMRYHLSKFPTGPSTPLVCKWMQSETMDLIKFQRVTLRRVRFPVRYLTHKDLVSQAKATAEQLLPNECPYGRNYEVHVELPSERSISQDALEFQLGHILHILLHCHKDHLLDPVHPCPGLSVLYHPVTVTDEEDSTLECNFEGDGTIIRAASICGSLAPRLASHISYIISVMFNRLKRVSSTIFHNR